MTNIRGYIIIVLLAIVLIAFLRYVIPYLKSKITLNNLTVLEKKVEAKVNAAMNKITVAVNGMSLGETRKQWVMDELAKANIVIDDELDHMVETAYNKLPQVLDCATSLLEDLISKLTNGIVTPETALPVIVGAAKKAETVIEQVITVPAPAPVPDVSVALPGPTIDPMPMATPEAPNVQ
jgi:hypothetical protein